MRPAEGCGCVSSPRCSSSERSLRTVEEETASRARSTSVFEPTGLPVSTCSRTTQRRMSRCRAVRVCSRLICRDFTSRFVCSREQLCGDAAPEKAASPGQAQNAPAFGDQAERAEPRQSRAVDELVRVSKLERLVQAQAEHHALTATRRLVQ